MERTRISNKLTGWNSPREIERSPASVLIGYELTSVQPGQTQFEVRAAKQHTNSFGLLHGGILCALADSTMATAYATTLGPEDRFTTVELKINFLKPVRNSKLRATGKVLAQNQTTGLTQCEIVDERDQLIAHATSTFIRSGARAKKDVREESHRTLP